MSTSNTIVSNLLWRFLERCGAQLVSFVVSIIIARILGPEYYGIIAIINIYTGIISVFIDSGLGNAIIQKKDPTDLDYNSVFYFNILSSSILYLALFFLAIPISKFYNNPDLIIYIRVQSILLLISGIKNIQQSYVSKNLLFKKFFFSTLGGTIGAAIIGILLAVKGYGIWALIAQSLFNNLIDTIILWITVPFKPKFIFSIKRLFELFRYGWKLLVSSLIDNIYNKLTQFIIGKKYSPTDLSFYDKGSHFPEIIIFNINNSINSVLLPTMSNIQDDIVRLKELTSKSIKLSSYIIMPLMAGLAVCAESIVILLLKDQWLPCVFFIRIFCFSYAFYPIHTSNLNAIKALGRSDLFLILEIIKKIVGIIAILVSMTISVKAMAISILIISIINQIINSWPNKKLLNYSYIKQIKDIFPSIFTSTVMGIIVYSINFLSFSPIYKLFIQIPLGIISYILISKLFKISEYDYLKSIIKGYMKK